MDKIKVPSDIRKYEEKIKFFISFTYREWISLILTIVVPYLLNRKMILWRTPENLRVSVKYSLIALFAFYGFMELYGMNFEIFIYNFLKWLFSSTKKKFDREGDLLEY